MSGGFSFTLTIAPEVISLRSCTPGVDSGLSSTASQSHLGLCHAAQLYALNGREVGNRDPGRTPPRFHLVIYAQLIEISFILDVLQN